MKARCFLFGVMFEMVFFSMKLALEEQEFELHGSTCMWAFFG